MIGAGRTAFWHLKAYAGIRAARVVAIANPRSARGRLLQRAFRIPDHFRDAGEMIAQAPLDAVDLCVPAAVHKHYILAALARGLHVYSEKPLCPTAQECAEIVEANRACRRVVFNGFNYRFIPAFARLGALIRGGSLGRPGYVRFLRTTQEDPASGLTGPAIFSEMHSHFVDLLFSWGFGRPDTVQACGTRVLDWQLCPDTASLFLKYPAGQLAEITASFAAAGLAAEVLVIGSEAAAIMRGGSVLVFRHRRHWSLSRRFWLLCRDSLRLPVAVLANPFRGACRHFVEHALAGRGSECDEEAALRSLEVIEAGMRNAGMLRHGRGAEP